MNKIYKYSIPLHKLDEIVTIELPKFAEIIKIDNQYEHLAFWAIVNPEEKQMVTAQFRVVGTGHEFDYNEWDKHLGSVIFQQGHLVFHIFTKDLK